MCFFPEYLFYIFISRSPSNNTTNSKFEKQCSKEFQFIIHSMKTNLCEIRGLQIFNTLLTHSSLFITYLASGPPICLHLQIILPPKVQIVTIIENDSQRQKSPQMNSFCFGQRAKKFLPTLPCRFSQALKNLFHIFLRL